MLLDVKELLPLTNHVIAVKTRDENELTLFKLQRLNAIRASVSRYARQTGKKFKVEFKYPHNAVIITRTV